MHTVVQQQPQHHNCNGVLTINMTTTTTTATTTSSATTKFAAMATTTTTTAATNSNLLKTDLRYVPVVYGATLTPPPPTTTTLNTNDTIISTAVHCTTPRNMSTISSVTGAGNTINNTILNLLPSEQPTHNTLLSSNGTTLLPQVAYITNAPVTSVISNSASNLLESNNLSNLHSTTATTAPIPINLLVTTNNKTNAAIGGIVGTTGLDGCATVTPGIAIVQTKSPGLTGSIIIQNQPQFDNNAAVQLQALAGGTATGNILPILNQEMVKQIVVGNTSRTLLKSQVIPQNIALLSTPTHQQLKEVSAKSAALPTPQANKNRILLATNTTSNVTNSNVTPTVATGKNKIGTGSVYNKQQPPKVTFAEAFKSKMVLPILGAEPIMATVQDIKKTDGASSLDGGQATTVATLVTKPDKVTSTVKENEKIILPLTPITACSTQQNKEEVKQKNNYLEMPPLVQIQGLANINTKINKQLTKTQENETIVPTLPIKTMTEKQQSLLKAKSSTQKTPSSSSSSTTTTTVANIKILSREGNTSPRTKRSKSLNCASAKSTSNNVTERRRATTSDIGTVVVKPTEILLQFHKTKIPTQQLRGIKDDVHLIDDSEIINLIADSEDADAGILHEDSDTAKNVDQATTDKIPEIKKSDNIAIEKQIKTDKDDKDDKHDKDDKEAEQESKNVKTMQVDKEIKISRLIKQEKVPAKVKEDAMNAYTDVELSITSNHIKLEPKSEIKDDTNNNKDIKNKSPMASMNLLCDEKMLGTSNSSNSSISNCSVLETIKMPPLVSSRRKQHLPNTEPLSEINAYSSMLDMLSNFNMLNWKERIGSARGTNLRFQLNEFNLLQIHERCPPRFQVQTAYEKPICERELLPKNRKEQTDPLLYLCRRCNCHGPAADFLAPEFCSLECLKRDSRKRSRASQHAIQRKHARKEPLIPVTHSQSLVHSLHSQNIGGTLVKKCFRWSSYLSGKYENIAAPIDLFLNPFPTGPNNFQVGMKLEAIDPENCSLFCVCTVRAMQGYRLMLSFDGYDRMYDFWVNADSMDIFPVGWCTKTNRILQPPKGINAGNFSWSAYLTKEKGIPAHRHLFTHLNSCALPTRNPFKIGMHLEAEDLNDTGKLCVATVADVLEERIRVHFDGWDNCYDYWVHISSPYIHPCGWHEGRQQLIVPPEFENYSFNWRDYIRQQGNGLAANEELFAARDPIDFKPSMKLEVVDPRNSSLIRPATVVGRKGHRVKLHLDCWPSEYCFWVEDDSPDLHPIGWCDATGHDLEPPPGFRMPPAKAHCVIPCCRGIGNTKDFTTNTHTGRQACPYAPEYWRQKAEKPARVNSDHVVRKSPTPPPPPPLSYPLLKVVPLGRMQVQQPQENSKCNSTQNRPPTRQRQQQQQQQPQQQKKTTTLYLNNKQQQQHLESLVPASAPALHQTNSNSILPANKTESDSDVVMQQLNALNELCREAQISPVPLSDSSRASSSNGDSSEITLQIAKNFLYDYGPRLQQNFDLWQQNIAFDNAQIKRNPLHWSTNETCAFVQRVLKCVETTSFFRREDIDGPALLLLQQSDLTEMIGLKLGPAVKLYSNILQLRTLVVTEFGVPLILSQASS